MILQELARRDFSGIFAVRMHPNSAGTRSDFTKRLSRLQYPFLRVIAPEEKLDSYALLQTAQKVLTWGSTIGIEAAYWGIPSIVAGWGEYMALGSTYNPTSHAELMDLLLGHLEPKPIAGAIDYGFYAKNFGTPLKYVTPWGPFFALFKGKPIRPAHLNKAFASEKPTRFQKLQRSLWTSGTRRGLTLSIKVDSLYSTQLIGWLRGRRRLRNINHDRKSCGHRRCDRRWFYWSTAPEEFGTPGS